MRTAMQKLVETQTIEVDEKVTLGAKLPKSMVLYAVDVDHFVIAAKPLKSSRRLCSHKISSYCHGSGR